MSEAERDESLLLLARLARRAGVNPYSSLLAALLAETQIREAFPRWPDCDLGEVLRTVPEALEAPSWRDQLERRREAYARTFIGWKRSTPGMRDRGAKLIEPVTTSDPARKAHLKRELDAVARWINRPKTDEARVRRRFRDLLAVGVPAEARRLKEKGDPRPIAAIKDDLFKQHEGIVSADTARKRLERLRARSKKDKS